MKLRPLLLGTLGALVVLTLLAAPVFAQDFRGTITGTVADDGGSPLPGVTVTATNVATNVASRAVTDTKGFYRLKYLNPGKYSVSADLSGFQPVVRKGIEVRVGDSVSVDLKLAVGGVKEVVEVSGSAPLVDRTSGVTGQVIEREQIRELPLADGTAYMLSRLAPGVTEVSDLHFSRPMDNANLGGVVSNGVRGGNDFTLDGAPNIVSDRRVGFSPPSEAIAEFKVETNAFDAQQGHTAGAVINLALRSGTNDFHGSASYFNRDESRSENSIYSERAGQDLLTRGYDRVTATLGGPLFRDKTFFMGSFEHLTDVTAEPAFYSVPTEKMRRGDFSELLALGIVIYDPATGTTARRAFDGNVIPENRLNPIARNLISYYPQPNIQGAADLSSNYFSNQERAYDYNGAILKLDHALAPGHQLLLNGYWNKRTEDRYNWAGVVNGFEVSRGLDFRDNLGGTLGYSAVFNDRFLSDVRINVSKFGEGRDPSQSFDPATLGFNAQTVALMRGYQYLPRFDISGFATLGSQRSDYTEGFDRPFYNYGGAATATRFFGDHTVRAGYDLRIQRWDRTDSGFQGGRYNFTGTYTRQSNSAATLRGQSLAQFLLGIPTSGGNSLIDVNTDGIYTQRGHAIFLQDDWHLSRKLTVNAGVRVEIDEGLTEQDDRNIYGFTLTGASPIEAAALAAYAKNPIAQVPVDQFRVRGGLLYGSGAVYETLYKPLPRIGVAYSLDDRTVLRGGVGLFSFPYYFDAINQTGFSQSTLLVSTNNNGSTFIADLNTPFPNGLQQPTGSSLGLSTALGRDLVSTTTSLVQPDRKSPYYTRWQIGAQRDLGSGWGVEVNYVGSKGRNLPVRHDLNALPLQYVSTKAERDTANETFLAQAVTNPFAGLLAGTTINGATVQRQQLLRAYPQYLRLAVEEYNGSDSYNAGQIALQKRFSDALSVVTTYTYSKLTDELSYLNPGDSKLESRTSPDDRPHRATVGAVAKLPFGKGRTWGSNWKGLMNALFGGWRVSATYQFQSGQPIQWYNSFSSGVPIWNNIYFDPSCNAKDLRVRAGEKDANGRIYGLDIPAWDTRCFYFPDAQGNIADPRIAVGEANYRTFPSTLDNARYPDLHLLDIGISKEFDLPGGLELQVRMEMINAIDYTVYFDPDTNPRSSTFGLFRSQRNNPRDIQLGARLSF